LTKDLVESQFIEEVISNENKDVGATTGSTTGATPSVRAQEKLSQIHVV